MGSSGDRPGGQPPHASLRKHPEPEPPASYRAALRRGLVLMLGTLLLATGFVAAYAVAVHRPVPRDVPVGVVRGDGPARDLLAAVRGRTDQLKPVAYEDRRSADDALAARAVYAVLGSRQANGVSALVLDTASASAPLAAQLITTTLTAAAQRGQQPLTIIDRVPVSVQDPRGLVPFYLALGLVLGGYLGSVALVLSIGTVPRDLGRAAIRIGALAAYAVLLGLAGALVAGPILEIWSTRLTAVAAAGALVAFAAGMAAAAAQGWLGLVGTGLVILVLVVLGNPSSGGIYPPEFLPAFFTAMHWWNVPGLATDLVRSAAYFGGSAARRPLIGLALWVAGGLVGLLGATAVVGSARSRRHAR